MLSEQRLVQRPLLVGLTAVLAVVLGLALLASLGGPAFAQSPGTSTATTGTTTQGASAASPTAPSTGSGVAASGSNSAPIIVGGIVVVAASLAAMGYSLRKRA